MRYLPRYVELAIARAVRRFPAVGLTAPRRAGKTSRLCHALARAVDHLLVEQSGGLMVNRGDPPSRVRLSADRCEIKKQFRNSPPPKKEK